MSGRTRKKIKNTIKSLPQAELRKLIFSIVFSTLTFTSFSAMAFITYNLLLPTENAATEKEKVLGESVTNKNISVTYPRVPQVIPAASPQPTSVQELEENNDEIEMSKPKVTQIDEVTYSVEVSSDNTTAGAQEIVNALNNYRSSKGVSTLLWDPQLAAYAQSRADLFAANGSTDKHAGFNNFLNNNGFSDLGFNSLGENSSYGYHVSGNKLIEEVYAADAPHDNNQLDSKWTHIGVGVNGTATDLIFGGDKQ